MKTILLAIALCVPSFAHAGNEYYYLAADDSYVGAVVAMVQDDLAANGELEGLDVKESVERVALVATEYLKGERSPDRLVSGEFSPSNFRHAVAAFFASKETGQLQKLPPEGTVLWRGRKRRNGRCPPHHPVAFYFVNSEDGNGNHEIRFDKSTCEMRVEKRIRPEDVGAPTSTELEGAMSTGRETHRQWTEGTLRSAGHRGCPHQPNAGFDQCGQRGPTIRGRYLKNGTYIFDLDDGKQLTNTMAAGFAYWEPGHSECIKFDPQGLSKCYTEVSNNCDLCTFPVQCKTICQPFPNYCSCSPSNINSACSSYPYYGSPRGRCSVQRCEYKPRCMRDGWKWIPDRSYCGRNSSAITTSSRFYIHTALGPVQFANEWRPREPSGPEQVSLRTSFNSFYNPQLVRNGIFPCPMSSNVHWDSKTIMGFWALGFFEHNADLGYSLYRILDNELLQVVIAVAAKSPGVATLMATYNVSKDFVTALFPSFQIGYQHWIISGISYDINYRVNGWWSAISDGVDRGEPWDLNYQIFYTRSFQDFAAGS